ncbi:MAG: FHA domain-containing protein [Deltaproteobacteria bacterium]|nr:FHA domain-containing protein [Deltaproteobacteria bacterium]
MIICPQCGKENQDHYKFCLGCGAELQEDTVPPASAERVATAEPRRDVPPTDAQAPVPATGKTPPSSASESLEPSQASASNVPSSIPHGVSPGPLPAAAPAEVPPPFQAPAEAPSPFQAPKAPSPFSTAPAPSPSDVSTAPVSPFGSTSKKPAPIKRSGTKPPESALAGGHAELVPPKPLETDSPPAPKIPCPNCQQLNPAGFAFCGNCGGRLQAPAAQAPRAASPKPSLGPKARLALIRPDGSEGGRHVLAAQETVLGRGSGPLFDSDGYLSPEHVRVTLEGDQVTLENLGSLNGVFVRLTSDEALDDGDIFRIGQELLRFDAIDDPSPAEDGTEILGSPNPGYWGRLSLIVRRGVDGSSFPLMGAEMLLGRERGDILFSDDGYVSGLHAKLAISANGSVELSDLGSSNGTFVKLNEPRTVPLGTFLLMGQQLFRIEAP